MTRSKRPRKAYRPRPVTAHTMALALDGAAKPAAQDRADVIAKLASAVHALCAGVAVPMDWSIASGAVAVGLAIERRGVVRGLHEHLRCAEQVLQSIYDRCQTPTLWLRPTLTADEADTLRLLLDLHAYQVEQLSKAELLAAMAAAFKNIITQGHQATMVRDLQRMTA